MKKRIRTLIRQYKWHVVELDRASLYKLFENTNTWGDEAHYKEIRAWCAKTFPKGSWEASFNPNKNKKFVFKEDKYVTLFKLKWSR